MLRVPLLVVLIAAGLGAVELVPRFTGQPKADDLLEWELTGIPAEWLVTDVERTPELVLTDPLGKIWHRRAFLAVEGRRDEAESPEREYLADGPEVLRIRHCGRVPGVHRWTLLDPLGTSLGEGQVTLLPPAGPTGPIHRHPGNQRLLAFASGEPFIPIGPNIAWALGPDRLANMERYFSRLAASGGTHARVWLASWCGQIEGTEPDAYDLPQAWLTDRILALARSHGIRLTVVIDNHHDLVHGKRFPYGGGNDYVSRARAFLAAQPGEQYARKLRYLLARWGADDTVACWELFNEVDMACLVRDISIPWITGATHLFHILDQDDRLSTVSWAGPDWEVVFSRTEVDLVQLRGYVHEWTMVSEEQRVVGRDGIGLLEASAAQANRGGRPFLYGEVGYQGLERANVGNDLDVHGLLLRQQAWAGFLLGGCGSGMNWWWDVYIDDKDLWGQYSGLAEAVRRIDWNGRGLRPLEPNAGGNLRVLGWVSPDQALLWPHIRSDTWYNHLVEELERPVFRGPVRFTLPGMRAGAAFTLTWLDQITGTVLDTGEVVADATGGVLVTVPADCRDRVLILRLR